MGKRKSSSKPQGPKRRDPLPTLFTCLFCNHENSVSVKLDKKAGVGTLECKVCGQKFQCGINYLAAAVDVYSEWVDAADAVAQEAAAETQPPKSSAGRAGASSRRIDEEEDLGGYGGEGMAADDDDYE
ncbi:Elf1-domain-containing protein [Trichocladium antarcticum]|uniref:Transcription elongation factor 1 homolog n=1 Tax=Trichocladium antarcticum TaxID=1450529 RepID=A0AAN6URA0_9PEZI|nr:Elf1-domain-containing protein [Trichocladium antarcticum]